MNLARRLRYWSRVRNQERFLSCGDASLTWGQFYERASRIAQGWRAHGVQPGDRVACLLPNCIEWCLAFGASIEANAVFVPLNTMFGPGELCEILAETECTVIVATPRLFSRIGLQAATGDLDVVYIYSARTDSYEPLGDLSIHDGSPLELSVNDTDALTICYTSGTTGVPKGVVHTHASVDAMLSGLALGFGLSSDDIVLITAPLAFAGGYLCSLAPALYSGMRAIVEPSFDAERALDLMMRERVTMYGGVPPLWQRLANTPAFAAADLSSLRHAYTGGAPVSVALLRQFQAKGVVIRQSYGCTEACGGATMADKVSALARPQACGQATIALDLRIVDASGQDCALGTSGEIILRGAQMMREYWRQPALTQEAIRDGWYHTGDVGYFDEQRAVIVVDRIKNMIITGGVNVYPTQVERVMAGIAGILEVAVIGVESQEWGEEVVAVVVAAPGVSASTIQREARELLGGYKAPKRVRLAPGALPKTSSGKIKRSELNGLFQSLSD